jgi:hypothetical protein
VEATAGSSSFELAAPKSMLLVAIAADTDGVLLLYSYLLSNICSSFSTVNPPSIWILAFPGAEAAYM